MHTSRELSSAAFQIRLDDRRASLGDVFAGFSEHDRADAANGRVAGGGLRMTGNRVTGSYVEGVREQSTDAPAPDREAVATTHRSLHEHSVTVQTYRRLSRDEAPARL